MIKEFESIIYRLIQSEEGASSYHIFNITEQFDVECQDYIGVAMKLNAAFLMALSGGTHQASESARSFLSRMADSVEWEYVARFYLKGIDLVFEEIESVCAHDPYFSSRLKALFERLSDKADKMDQEEMAENIWSVFFPEASGILSNGEERVKILRAKRMVAITELNKTPVTNPTRQILFTSNVLLTVPQAIKSIEKLTLSHRLKEMLMPIIQEPQIHWYDHPIQIGVEPDKNEILYGLRGLEKALEFERDRGNMSHDDKLICVLSVSVTHQKLQDIAKSYLEEVLAPSGNMKNIDAYVFTEVDTQRVIDEILTPAADHYLKRNDSKNLLSVFGVDGEYGRHYSFLKAIAPFWNILIQPQIRAAFKIDLDQVFPQKELVEQTGASAFEHLKTPLWGSLGLDSDGQLIELGMIAGALVNEKDIGQSLFTPDVLFPEKPLSPDEYVFYSLLPQALSTEAEMMTRYASDTLDGKKTCIQRIHVTGGTTGILVDSLRRFRPFTPSFMGRAEDQAYILSVLNDPGTRLAYVHKDGLIMRHDKEAFAQEAIQSAHMAKLVGDYIRILYFSSYARILTEDVVHLKDIVDPFTGCFISKIPFSVVFLRFAFKAASFFDAGKDEQGLEFVKTGAKRIINSLDFMIGENSLLRQSYEKERLGWNLYYDILSAIEDGLNKGDGFALDLKKKAESIVRQCAISSGSE